MSPFKTVQDIADKVQIQRVVPGVTLPDAPLLGKRAKKKRKGEEMDLDAVVAYFREVVSCEALREDIPMLVDIMSMEFDVAHYEMRSWSGSPRSTSDPELSRSWISGEKVKRETLEDLLDSLALDISAINEKDQFRLGMSCGSLSAMSDEILSSPTSPGRSPKRDWKPKKNFFSRRPKPKEKDGRERKTSGSRVGISGTDMSVGMDSHDSSNGGTGTEYHVVDHVTVVSTLHHIVKAKTENESTVLLKVLLSASREKQRQMQDEAEIMETVCVVLCLLFFPFLRLFSSTTDTYEACST